MTIYWQPSSIQLGITIHRHEVFPFRTPYLDYKFLLSFFDQVMVQAYIDFMSFRVVTKIFTYLMEINMLFVGRYSDVGLVLYGNWEVHNL